MILRQQIEDYIIKIEDHPVQVWQKNDASYITYNSDK